MSAENLTALERRSLEVKIKLAELLPDVVNSFIAIDGKMITVEHARYLCKEYDVRQWMIEQAVISENRTLNAVYGEQE